MYTRDGVLRLLKKMIFFFLFLSWEISWPCFRDGDGPVFVFLWLSHLRSHWWMYLETEHSGSGITDTCRMELFVHLKKIFRLAYPFT